MTEFVTYHARAFAQAARPAISMDVTNTDRAENLTTTEWRLLSSFVAVLQPLDEATSLACSASYPTLSEVIPLVHCTQLMLMQKLESGEDGAIFAKNLLTDSISPEIRNTR